MSSVKVGPSSVRVRIGLAQSGLADTILIEGTPAGLRTLAKAFRSGRCELLCTTTYDPAPYHAFIPTVRVEAEPNATKARLDVSQDGQVLTASGGQGALDILANNFEGTAAHPDAGHSQLDGADYFLADDTIMIVIDALHDDEHRGRTG